MGNMPVPPGGGQPGQIMNEILAPAPSGPAPGAPPLPLPQTGIPGPSHMAPPPGPGAPPPPAPGAGGGYEFRPEEFQPVIDEVWNLIHGPLAEAKNRAIDLVDIDPPGNEPVSKSYVQAANDHGKSYNNWLTATINGLTEYVTKLEETRDRIGAADENAGRSIKGHEV